MGSLFRTLALNIGIFLSLFFGVLLLVSLGGDLVTLAKMQFREGDKRERYLLPPYEDQEAAAKVFKDLAKTEQGYVPILGWRRKPLASDNINIDASGFRQHRDGRDNLPDAKRIGFFGGSAVWGTGVDDDSTVPALFDLITDDYEVSNYGEGGWTSRQGLALLINLANQGLLPDVVVFYEGGNDVEIGCNFGFGEGLNETHEAPRLRRITEAAQNRSYLYRNFYVPALDTFRRVSGRKGFDTDRRCTSDSARVARVAETMLRNWEIAKLITEANGGHFAAFLQPLASIGTPKVDYMNLDPDRLAQYPAVYPAIRDLMATRDWAIDISDSFDGETPLYIDHAHVTRPGNRIIAERIRDALSAGDN